MQMVTKLQAEGVRELAEDLHGVKRVGESRCRKTQYRRHVQRSGSASRVVMPASGQWSKVGLTGEVKVSKIAL